MKNYKEYQITIPSVIESDGKFKSHVFHNPNRNSRREQQDSSAIGRTSEGEILHIEVPTFDGQKLKLQMSKNTKFTAPGLVIEEGNQVRQHNLDCHYTGHIKDQPNSLVSLSYCNGLVSSEAFGLFFP